MASTNFTTHYSIPLPLGTDLTTPMDYNEAAEAVDTALFGAVTDAGNASEAAGEAVNTANTASAAVDAIGADLALEKAKIVQLQTRMTAAENDIDDVYTDVTDMITAYKEPSATSTHAYAIGDYFIYNETLYKATAAIAIGATIVPNTNCVTTNVSSELLQIISDLANKADKTIFNNYLNLKNLVNNGDTCNITDGTKLISIMARVNDSVIVQEITIPAFMLQFVGTLQITAGSGNYLLNATLYHDTTNNRLQLGTVNVVGWTFTDVVIACY